MSVPLIRSLLEAAPSQAMNGIMFYHGVSSEAAAKNILQSGIDPSFTELKYGSRKSALRPLPGRVYLTGDLSYAIIYALGGVLAGTTYFEKGGHGHKELTDPARGRYKHVFGFSGSDLVDVGADEDSIGEIVSGVLSGNRSKQYNWDVLDQFNEPLQILAKKHLTRPQFESMKSNHGLVDYIAKSGKKLFGVIPDQIHLAMIEAGAHLSHNGALKPSKCWRFDAQWTSRLASDGSNFFDLAIEVL